MNTSRNWEKPIRRLELLMRLKSFPVALKLLEDKAALSTIPFCRRLDRPTTLCQLITLVRNFDWTVGAVLGDFLGPMCPSMIGLGEVPEHMADGTFRSIVWTKTKADGKKYELGIPRIPTGQYEAVALAPLVYNPFDPDMVLIYANPAQMMLLINSLQFEDYEVMEFFCVGESSCSDAIARCYLTGKPSLTIPCYGERRYGHAQDEDLVMALRPEQIDKALRGMETLYRRGIRYPISYAGAEMDVSGAFPGSYGQTQQLKSLRGDDNRLLLGVTGGIASGKTTVAKMLEELGAPIVDFDLIARLVVEPGQHAYNQIVEYFGEQVLQEDKTLDRKKLSDIVFRDMEKRKKLESFTHPAIGVEFMRQVNELSAKDPDAIIQVVIPLLIELNMGYMFHKLLLVYTSPEVQNKRLAARDGISEADAAVIMRNQLPIDEKVGYADFVINNEGDPEETRAKVEALWAELKKLQQESKKQ
ncbi:MAG: dephospho-CoA kinase [Proteobacteria bacterium]|nr:dephospho-CoA kinase [Pseudomonadota bacterium]